MPELVSTAETCHVSLQHWKVSQVSGVSSNKVSGDDGGGHMRKVLVTCNLIFSCIPCCK